MNKQDFNDACGCVDTYILSDLEKDYIIRSLKSNRELCTDTILTQQQEKHIYNAIMCELGGDRDA